MSTRMKAVQFSRFGDGHEVVDFVDVPEPTPPEPGEILIEILAAPINPSDFLNFRGLFGAVPPALPAMAGGEAVGTVAALGAGIDHLKIGDRVLALWGGRGNWCQKIKASAEGVAPLPAEADILQLAMMAVNPATAWHMLNSFVKLQPGEWVLQNAGNSAVGHNVAAIAKSMGLRTVNLVRREDQIGPLLAAGADAAIVDGPDLVGRVRSAVENAPIRLAFDAVAGDATARLGSCLARSGTIVIYGLLSGGDSVVHASDIVFRDIAVRGFWFTHWFESAAATERNKLYEQIGRLIAEGTIKVDIEGVYPMEKVKDALLHAARAGRTGKVLLLPNPHLTSHFVK
jgi:mitochondrial enoyl-[acyl-carrier protein] reductase / trans-2-enoyl-CoA reductase